MTFHSSALAFTASLILLLPIEAATITPYTRDTFPTTVSGVPVTTQNFDSLPGNQTISTVGAVTFSASLGSPYVSGLYVTTSSFYHLGSTSNDGGGFSNELFTTSETATLSFAQAITAFAIDIISIAPFSGAYQAELNTGDKILSSYAPFDNLPYRQVSAQFIGFVSDTPFTSVTISALSKDNFFAQPYVLDTLRYAEAPSPAVPEPATLFSLATALLALGYKHRRL